MVEGIKRKKPHPKHPPCPACGKALYKRMEPGSVKKTDAWAYCRNKKCSLCGVDQSQPTASRLPRQSPQANKSSTKSPATQPLQSSSLNPVDKLTSDTIAKAKARIEKAIAQNGPYTHNIIGIALSMVHKEIGEHVANELIGEYKLTELYGIQSVDNG